MRRSAHVPATVALVVLMMLWGIASRYPVVRPLVERFAVLTIAVAVLVVLLMAGIRSHPEPAVTDLDRVMGTRPGPEAIPRALRQIAGPPEPRTGTRAAGEQEVGGRALIHRIGRERLRARGLDPDDPGAAAAAQDLTGPHLWVLISTPPDQPVRRVDLQAALERLEAL